MCEQAHPAQTDFDILRDNFRWALLGRVWVEGAARVWVGACWRPPPGRPQAAMRGFSPPPPPAPPASARLAASFIRSEADDAGDAWEVRLAKRYYR